ncbi:MAG: CoA-binding protein [Desulfocapsaceae bacterium]|nr:CoA-binding protein [Desulfocapsaceae bacterium]
MINFNNLDEIPKLLRDATTIAIVGLSPNRERPSNMVARYLIDAGYTIYPVNPGQEEILGEKCYPSLLDIPDHIDIVNIFRKAEDVGPIVEQAVQLDCKCIWMQQGIVNHDAAELARKNSKTVIMDRCIKVDHTAFIYPN